MPTKNEFVLKDSPPEVLASHPGVAPKGRSYDAHIAKTKPGAARVDEILLGTKLACVAITDDEPGTLKSVSKLNPWHEAALKTITGSKEEAHKPLTHILKEHFGLQMDHYIDINKVVGGTHLVDAQGYIAHDDEKIVVAFRCTTTGFDWLTNLSIASSEWEIDEDVAQGHSEYCSCFMGRRPAWCYANEKKPRVHTGFYNSLLNVIPLFQAHVDPLLGPNQPPRTLYVVGHSLGAGISTLAAAHFLLAYDWTNMPQRLLNISAGTPRSCKASMAALIEERLAPLVPAEKASIFRVVMDEDAVCRVPLERQGYVHAGRMVFLTSDSKVLVNPRAVPDIEPGDNTKQNTKQPRDEDTPQSVEESEKDEDASYQRKVARIPKPFRDHCPDCYLAPLVQLYKQEESRDD